MESNYLRIVLTSNFPSLEWVSPGRVYGKSISNEDILHDSADLHLAHLFFHTGTGTLESPTRGQEQGQDHDAIQNLHSYMDAEGKTPVDD
jgi:hypothetical protein